ncbi:MAG TPA: DNA-binding protein WhiA [Acholeplasmataceae bacterium]|nr:DNA-binding protein WhiA [Acholeplasmataceae bacterium]
MSFSREVKKEIATLQNEDCCNRAELYALIRFRSTLTYSNRNFKIIFTTTSNATARRIVSLVKNLYSIQVVLLQKERDKLDKKPLYYIVIPENGRTILEDLKILNEDLSLSREINPELFAKDCCKAALLRGAFLARGSVNDPTKNKYHLELVANNLEEAEFLVKILEEMGISAKVISRAKGEVVYIKRAEHIADFLKFIGANNSLFAFEDLRIKKDLNNYVNRIMNCDVANEEKAIASAKKQLETIKFLEENYGLMNLTPRLLDAVILRMTYPDDSLSELSANSEKTIHRYLSKSGLSHCFKDLEKLAEEVKKNKPTV